MSSPISNGSTSGDWPMHQDGYFRSSICWFLRHRLLPALPGETKHVAYWQPSALKVTPVAVGPTLPNNQSIVGVDGDSFPIDIARAAADGFKVIHTCSFHSVSGTHNVNYLTGDRYFQATESYGLSEIQLGTIIPRPKCSSAFTTIPNSSSGTVSQYDSDTRWVMAYGRRTYLVAVNSVKSPVTVDFVGISIQGSIQAETLYRERNVVINNEVLSDTFTALEVHAYKLPTGDELIVRRETVGSISLGAICYCTGRIETANGIATVFRDVTDSAGIYFSAMVVPELSNGPTMGGLMLLAASILLRSTRLERLRTIVHACTWQQGK